MRKRFRLYLQTEKGCLRIVPLGRVTLEQVEPILGAAQSGLRIFPVVVVDLREAAVVAPAVTEQLQQGLQQLVAERRLALGLEPDRWILQTASAPCCHGRHSCQQCRHHRATAKQAQEKATGES